MIKETANGIILQIKISPNSSKNEFIKTGDVIKLKITAPPVDGKANKFVIEILSKTFKVPKTNIKILHGETSKEKTLEITNIDNEKKIFIANILNNVK